MQYSKLSIVMPVFNEVSTIETILDHVRRADTSGLDKEIIVVDDGSTDGTRELLRERSFPLTTILFHDRNLGKGSAVRTAIQAASGEILLIQDADLEYHPNEYPLLLAPFLKQDASVVYGSRELSGQNRHSSVLFHIGGRMVTTATNLLYGSQLTDVPTCYKAFRRDILADLPLKCQRFEFCPEVTAELLKRRIPIVEVPISYHPRDHNKGKKIKARDGLEAIGTLLRCRFNL